jgi:hypothetical protein
VIQQRRRTTTARGSQAEEGADPDQRIRVLEKRVEHLEALVEGLQDSVHREAGRHDKEMKALEERTRTPEVARAVHEYSRELGA